MILLGGLIGYVLWKGGAAFSPGKLSSRSNPGADLGGFHSHADFENQCSLCHAPLATTQDLLCLNCHQRTAAEIESKEGIHSRIDMVNSCAVCHSDHKGREHDLNQDALVRFDHSRTSFSLVQHQVDYSAGTIDCADCHFDQTGFPAAQTSCSACHRGNDATFMLNHVQSFGRNCILCHDGLDSMVNFDHQAGAFPLEGLHQEVTCTECHHLDRQVSLQARTVKKETVVLLGTGLVSERPEFTPFAGAPLDCAGCHEEPELHKGSFSPDCQSCHTPTGWAPANLDGSLFEHTARSGFSLARHQKDAQGSPISCSACHGRDLQNFDINTCINCHSQAAEAEAASDELPFMVSHQEQYGSSCLQCHDGADRMRGFDHASVYPLEGRHGEVECAVCHMDKVFAGTPTECVQCHAEPALHAGLFGLRCQYCHTADAWVPARLRIHSFPTEHGKPDQATCQTCHEGSYAEYSCYGCHEHQPEAISESHSRAGVAPEKLPDCAACHPTGLKDET